MHCPRCATDISDRVERCPACAFTLGDLDTQAGAPPLRTGAVTDLADVLSAADRERLAARAELCRHRTGADLAVLVAPRSPLPPPQYVFWLFNRWDVGGAENRGLLILLSLDERRIECEVGYALEAIIDDENSGRVLDEHVVPLLARGDIAAGLWQAVDVLAQILEGGEKPPLLTRVSRWLPAGGR